MNLSPRQAEVLKLVHAGLLDKQIGVELHMSTYTVRAHLRAIYIKLGVQNRVLAALQWERSIVKSD